MKKLFILFIATLFFTGLKAQSLGGNRFDFKNGLNEWSEPLTTTLHSKWMEKRNLPPVQISIRVRFAKKVVWACHYEFEITNTSTEHGIQFEISNGEGKDKVKLKAGSVKNVGAIFAPMKPHVKKPEDCINTSMSLSFDEIEGYD